MIHEGSNEVWKPWLRCLYSLLASKKVTRYTIEAMKYEDIQTTLQQSATITLLQSPHASLILSFLHHQFKQNHQVTIPHPHLQEKLEDYLEALQESYPGRYPGTAVNYLRTWCDENHRFLRRYYPPDQDDPVYELTPDTERAITWVETLQKHNAFIGTESRFLRIFDLLNDIVTYSTQDIEARLARLEADKANLEAQIADIKATGQVPQYTQTQVKERFFEANDITRRLLADFREVEENFRRIAREVQEKQLAAGARKGQIVQYVLEADTELKESDQGRSFYAFWQFLMSPSKQSDLERLLTATHDLPEISASALPQSRLPYIKRDLIEAGTKIVASNRRLSEQLRRLLDEQNLAEARRVTELATEIKKTAVSLAHNPPQERHFFYLETLPQVDLPLDRPLWSAPATTHFTQDAPTEAILDLATFDLTTLYNQFYIDESRLRRQLAILLKEHASITLGQLLAIYPLQKGLAELITYLALATHHQHHYISTTHSETISLQPDNGNYARIPLVTFYEEPAHVS